MKLPCRGGNNCSRSAAGAGVAVAAGTIPAAICSAEFRLGSIDVVEKAFLL